MKNNHQKADVSFEFEDNNLTVIIDTERLHLESVKQGDTKAYHSQLYSDPIVMEKYATGETRNLEYVQDKVDTWVKRWQNNDPFSSLAVRKNEDDSFVGQVVLGYGDNKGEAELAYLFAKEQWQKGYGTEAVFSVANDYAQELIERNYNVEGNKFTSMVLTTLPENEPSRKIAEKSGFKEEKIIEKFDRKRNLYRKIVAERTR